MDKEQRQVVVICAVRVYNDGMNNPFNPNRPWQVGKYHIEDHEKHDDNSNNRVPFLSVLNLGPPIPRTCEHCKFYGKFSGEMTDCINEHVNYLVDYLAINKDFGCIFWEGKE